MVLPGMEHIIPCVYPEVVKRGHELILEVDWVCNRDEFAFDYDNIVGEFCKRYRIAVTKDDDIMNDADFLLVRPLFIEYIMNKCGIDLDRIVELIAD